MTKELTDLANTLRADSDHATHLDRAIDAALECEAVPEKGPMYAEGSGRRVKLLTQMKHELRLEHAARQRRAALAAELSAE